ncbi:2-amino-4-hydroxy-6-hydroxymethyldihydropteridine diphosphokinase [bacterium]|nr:2-amino-4-hydroxy-6-hydroxymethyldihydropteridine diphosphokinase [bacterium]
MRSVAVISVGSNINPERWIAAARVKVEQVHTLMKSSTFIKTKPVGYTNQADFVNGAWMIETEMDKTSLYNWLHDLENDCQRVRTENKYGPRTIDLDIIIWNGMVVDDDVYSRDFLKTSILELLPNQIITF